MSIRRRALGALGIAALGVAAVSPSRAAPLKPSAWLQPAKVTPGETTTLHGRHLRHSTYYTLLLAVPDLRKGAQERLFGIVRTTKSGTLKTSVRMPIVTRCGRASVYLYPLRSQTAVTLSVTLTRCGKSTHTGEISPPPPPNNGKKPPTPPKKP